jgi:heterotetrameric sarcosine oxidase gamma subunit
VSAPDASGSLASVLVPGRHGAPGDDPVRIARRRCDLVQLAARKGRADDLTAAMRAAYRLQLPLPGHAATADDLAALWLQPNAWMLVAPPVAEGAFARAVKAACGDAGSVVDQTHGRVAFTLSGRNARRVLQNLCRLDLHPRAFGPGRVAATPMAEVACLLHQRDDVPSFDLIVFSTFATHFAGALTHAAAGVGYEIS